MSAADDQSTEGGRYACQCLFTSQLYKEVSQWSHLDAAQATSPGHLSGDQLP